MNTTTHAYKILLATHPALRKKSDPVDSVDHTIKTLMMDMTKIMVDHEGVGLAAPQIGVHKRVLTMDIRHVHTEKPNMFCMANPEIIWRSETQSVAKEYCFSVPEIGVQVTRPEEVKIRYIDEHNTEREIHATGILARCAQHEMDHLDGIVTLDYLSPLRRKLALKKLQRMEKYQEGDAGPTGDDVTL
jgi:peptide deformylase